MKILIKALILAYLAGLSVFMLSAYRAFQGKLDLLKSELILEVEGRLQEEYDFIQEDLQGVQTEILEEQKKLIPQTTTVKSGLPIF